MVEWMLDEFDRDSGRFIGSYRISGLSDADAGSLLGVDEVRIGLVYDIPETSLAEISARFGLMVYPEHREYLLGTGDSGSA
ncbi:hypothetical protein [Nocardiopsis sp. NPDC006938]|uniref:hypothetical protein n=1 Tax=Nocardiopsis sp. NPDC006938 TaxID=3364337 RepID=UPI0036AE1A0F